MVADALDPVRRGRRLFGKLLLVLAGGCGDGDGGDGGSGTTYTAAVQGGSGQSATVGTALANPVEVRVTDQDGNPADVTIDWTVESGGGSVTSASGSTGADGVASNGWTLGSTVGAQSLRATVRGASPAASAVFGATGLSAGGGLANGRILFVRYSASGRITMHTIGADGSGEASIGDGFSPTFSPDGRSVAFSCNDDICLMNADGTNVRNITNSARSESEPTWSSTGRIAYQKDGNTLYWRLADGTGGESELTEGENGDDQDTYPTYSRDGGRIAFAANRNAALGLGLYNIYTMNADGTNQVAVTTAPSGVNRNSQEPSWSPDGTQIAFYRIEGTGPSATYNIWVMNADGSGATARTTFTASSGVQAFGPKWSPDGATIAYTRVQSGGAQEVWTLPGGRVTQGVVMDWAPAVGP